MLFGSIDVFMPQYIGHKVDVAGFVIQIGTVGAPQLMGRDVFHGCYGTGILFNEFFDRTHRHTFFLH